MQPSSPRRVRQDRLELDVAEVGKAEGGGEREAALQPRVVLRDHLLHLILIPDHDHRDVLAGAVVHLRDERVERRLAKARRVQRVCLVDHEHLARGARNVLRDFGLRVADILTDQVGWRAHDKASVAQQSEALEDAAVDGRNSRLTGARVA